MNKILKILIFLIFIGCSAVYSSEKQTKVNCLYINGANNNTPAMEEWFFNGVKKMHPNMKKALESSPFVHEKLLKNGNFKINEEPLTFFWGDKSLNDLSNVTEELNVTSLFSPFLAQFVRSFLAHCLHDAIWVQKDHNMQKIVKDLHNDIRKIHKKGEKVILFGYSAGSFVTYEYLFYKLPVITWEEISNKLNLEQKEREYIEKTKVKATCLDAITSSRLAIYSTSGDLIPNTDFEEFKKAYNFLDDFTNEACVPENTILGTVNYASPLVLFYSDITNPMLEINHFNKDFFIYMKNYDMFWITVNFADDPLGYPLMKNLNQNEISKIHNISFDAGGRGFFHDKSDVKSPATFIGAHTSYWKASKKFSKAVADAYKEGYLNFYDD